MLCVTIGKEAIDDYDRYRRDRESNSTPYTVIGDAHSPIMQARAQQAHRYGGVTSHGSYLAVKVPSSKLRVGDLIVLHKNQRVPADLILLKTYDLDASDDAVSHEAQLVPDSDGPEPVDTSKSQGGTCFVRTDQLDGETDWKLRIAVPVTQQMAAEAVSYTHLTLPTKLL